MHAFRPLCRLVPIACAALVLALAAPPADATDCDTDCEGHCTSTDTWWSPILGQQVSSALDQACMTECAARRDLACSTKIDQCNIWSSNPNLYTEFRAAVAVVEQANRAGKPADKHECHRFLDYGSTGAGAAGVLRSAWEYGLDAALWLKNFSMPMLVVTKGAEHFMHCACSQAHYREPGGNGDGGGAGGNDMIDISASRADGAWWHATGKISERAQLLTTIRTQLGSFSRHEVSFYSSSQPTTAHAICGAGSQWRRDHGSESPKVVAAAAATAGLQHCLIRTVNGDDTAGIFDLVSVSLWRDDGSWGFFSGPRDQEESLRQRAQQFLGGPADGARVEYYSSRRNTATAYGCEAGTDTSDDGIIIGTSETGVRYSAAGRVNGPLAQDLVQRGMKRCWFSVYDVTF